MTTPYPSDPVVESASEAAHHAALAVKFVVTIADVMRRHAQQRQAKDADQLPPVETALPYAAGELKQRLPGDVSAALLEDAEWPRLAQQIMALQEAGVDLEDFLPRTAEIAVTVRDQVEANRQQIAREGTTEWAGLVRETLPDGPVREAILSSPAWPDIAQQMAQMDQAGLDVRGLLETAQAEGLGVDQAVTKVLQAQGDKKEVPLTDSAKQSLGPLTAGLTVPRDLDLSDRSKTFEQLEISPQQQARYVGQVREALGDVRDATEQVVGSPQWPLLAARMAHLESQQVDPRERLARLATDRRWQEGPAGKAGERLVRAAGTELTRDRRHSLPSVGRVARASSTTVGPTARRAPAKTVAQEPAAPAVVPQTPVQGRRR